MQFSLLLVAAILSQAGESRSQAKASAGVLTLSHCLISLAEEAQVPAKEAGALTRVMVVAGQQVAAGQQLAQVDDSRPLMENKAAQFKLDAAREEATNRINVVYAEAAHKVAQAEVAQYEEANAAVPGTVSRTEVRRAQLQAKQTELAIVQAEFKLTVAGLEAKVREAEVDATLQNIENRKIRAPLDGIVTELRRHEGEWVQPGDTVLHLVRMDRLWIEGFLDAASYSPGEIDARPVNVRVVLAHGRQEVFQGKIVYVSPLVETGGEYRVRAEVFNRQENEHWLLRPGLTAEMDIRLR